MGVSNEKYYELSGNGVCDSVSFKCITVSELREFNCPDKLSEIYIIGFKSGNEFFFNFVSKQKNDNYLLIGTKAEDGDNSEKELYLSEIAAKLKKKTGGCKPEVNYDYNESKALTAKIELTDDCAKDGGNQIAKLLGFVGKTPCLLLKSFGIISKVARCDNLIPITEHHIADLINNLETEFGFEDLKVEHIDYEHVTFDEFSLLPKEKMSKVCFKPTSYIDDSLLKTLSLYQDLRDNTNMLRH